MNDERPIEKLLRRYAKKRRDETGAPPELHPATRRLLQGEVARQFSKRTTERGGAPSFLEILKGWWPWLAGSAAVLAVTGFCVWMFFGGQENKFMALQPASGPATTVQLAKNEPAPARPAEKDKAVNTAVAGAMREVETPMVAEPPPTPFASDGPSQLTLADAGNYRAENKSAPAPGLDLALAAGRSRTTGDETFGAAKTDGVRRDRSATLAATAPERQPVTTLAAKEESKIATRGDKLAARPSAPLAAPASASVAGERLKTSESATGFKIASSVAPGGVGTVAIERRNFAPIARGGGLERARAPDYSQSFANISPPSARYEKTVALKAGSPVLANFQIEQTGNQLRVIDADGSTYLGEISAEPPGAATDGFAGQGGRALKKNMIAKSALPMLLPPANLDQKTPNYFYRVAGTNRTLKQQVVFTWNFVEPTNAVAGLQSLTTADALGGEKQKLQQQPAQSNVLPLNSAINGRAELDAGQPIEINAVPVRQ
ncbi:MAG: hypothetical protein EXS35_12290 [Pedosphaera sp.]|nr:hypothetical protein [Pedosphaera sp.]